jgi:flavin-dependent dehydrogenase
MDRRNVIMKLQKNVENGMSRREFVKSTALKGAAVLAIGAGGLALPVSARSSDSTKITSKTIKEAAREIKVCRTADVVVVGGGPGGVGAALAAARNGADTVLIERYGYLGGMGTGGLVTIIPDLADINGKQQIAGITQEWIKRLDVREAADYPKKEHWGSTDKKLVDYYMNRSFFYASGNRVGYSAHIDAEISKCILNDMMEEAGVKTYLHAWGTEPVMEGNKVKGVIFESKSGRQAVMAKVVIDSTGDGDLLPYAGADFETNIERTMRIANLLDR